MKLWFFGAARCVTGSCHMVETSHGKLLIDCGMQQGADAKSGMDNRDFPFDAGEIGAVVLTHAHIDHSGLLPLLVKKGFSGKIIATDATAQLCSIMLPDSGHIQQAEADYENRKRLRQGKKPVEPIYGVEDARMALKLFAPVHYGDVVDVMPGIKVRLSEAGHMLGSAQAELWASENGGTAKLLFSGDIGHSDRPMIGDPGKTDGADYVVMEGTYGDRLHKPFVDGEAEFLGVVRSTFARGGNVVIPAFADGRTQELLYMLHKMFKDKQLPPDTPVYIDSPLGIEATKVYERVDTDYFDEETRRVLASGRNPLEFPSLVVAASAEESRFINADPECKIIISSSGMCEAGRIRHHLKHNLWRGESTILFSGYQAAGTLGRALLDGIKKVKLFGEEITVNAHIEKLEGMSGHGDKNELAAWLSGMKKKPRKLFLVHGEEDVLLSFSQDLEKLGYETHIPHYCEAYDAVADEASAVPDAVAAEAACSARAANDARELHALTERIGEIIGKSSTQDRTLRRVFAEDLKMFAEKWEKLIVE